TTPVRWRCCPAGPGSRIQLSPGTIPAMCFLWALPSITLPAAPSSALPSINPRTAGKPGVPLTSFTRALPTTNSGRPGMAIQGADFTEGFMRPGTDLADCALHAGGSTETDGLAQGLVRSAQPWHRA